MRENDAPYVAVIGPGEATEDEVRDAESVGALLARSGAVVVCGGLGGVMEAACKGAALNGGRSVGILPGRERSAGNGYASIVLATGLGELRNGLVVGSADAVIAIGGSWGTLSEIALAMRTGKPTFLLGGWQLVPPDGPTRTPAGTPTDTADTADVAGGISAGSGAPVQVGSAQEAVRRALAACGAVD
jgi:uncharacterized protein (TIGR00725 family)